MMSFFHQSIASALSFCEQQFHATKYIDSPSDYNRTVLIRIFFLSFLFSINIILANSALKECSVAFVQIFQSIIPLITMLISFVFLKIQYTIHHLISSIITCFGVALTCFGEISLTKLGFFITLSCCISSSLKGISIKLALSGDYQLQATELIARISPWAAIEMFFFSHITNEPENIFSSSTYTPNLYGTCLLLFSGVVAYFLNLLNFLATHYTSPLTMNIAGNVKQVLTIVISVFLFEKVLTPLNIVGIVISTIGSVYYSLIGSILLWTNKAESKNSPDMEVLIKENK